MEKKQQPKKLKQTIMHWSLMLILWIIMVLEAKLVIDILNWWSDPFYLPNEEYIRSRIIEMVALALSVVMVLYTFGVTGFNFIHIAKNGFKNVRYAGFIRINSLILTAFISHWAIFVSVALVWK